MRWIRRAAAAGGAAVLMGALVGCHVPQQWHSELILDQARDPVFSPDGTKLAFQTYAGLTPIDTNDGLDVYVYDLGAKTSQLVSVNGAGTNGGDQDSHSPVFSPDGTKLAFNSFATDLAHTDSNGTVDVYVRDLATSRTSLVSANVAGTDSGRGRSGAYEFAPDGTRIVFGSTAGDLVSTPDGNGTYDLYVRDLHTDTTELVSVNTDGSASAAGGSYDAVFSADGSKVAFTSNAGDLGPVDGNGTYDVFLRDLRTGSTELVSVNAAGTGSANAGSTVPLFVGRGSRVVFGSDASDLGPTDTNGVRDVYVRDLLTSTTELVSVNAAGTDSGDRQSTYPVVSPDGRLVAFTTAATNLGPPDPGDGFDLDVYVRDLLSGTTQLVSVNAAGTDGGNGPSDEPVFSPDSTRLAFTSDADDLGPTDTNVCVLRTSPFPCSDVYVRNLRAGTLSLASSDGANSLRDRFSRGPVFNPAKPDELAFASLFAPDGSEAIHLARP